MAEKKIDYEKLLKLKKKNEVLFWEKINNIHKVEGVILFKTDPHDEKKYITNYNPKYQNNVETVAELTSDIWLILNYLNKFIRYSDKVSHDEKVQRLRDKGKEIRKIKNILEKNNCFHWPFFNAYEELKRLQKIFPLKTRTISFKENFNDYNKIRNDLKNLKTSNIIFFKKVEDVLTGEEKPVFIVEQYNLYSAALCEYWYRKQLFIKEYVRSAPWTWMVKHFDAMYEDNKKPLMRRKLSEAAKHKNFEKRFLAEIKDILE